MGQLVSLLEKEMATHSSNLAWRVPWTEEPGGLQFMGLQRIGHDLAAEQQFILLGKPMAQTVKNPPAMQETWVQSLDWENPLKEAMVTHSSILPWRIPMDRGT